MVGNRGHHFVGGEVESRDQNGLIRSLDLKLN